MPPSPRKQQSGHPPCRAWKPNCGEGRIAAICSDLFRRCASGFCHAVLMDMRMPETDGLKAMRTSKAMPEDTAGPLRMPARPRSPMAPSAPQVPSSASPVATTGKVTGCPWKDDPNRPGTDQSQGQASLEGRKDVRSSVFLPCRQQYLRLVALQPQRSHPARPLHEPKTSICFAEQRAQAKTMFKPSAFTASRQSSDARMAGGTDSRTAHAL